MEESHQHAASLYAAARASRRALSLLLRAEDTELQPAESDPYRGLASEIASLVALVASRLGPESTSAIPIATIEDVSQLRASVSPPSSAAEASCSELEALRHENVSLRRQLLDCDAARRRMEASVADLRNASAARIDDGSERKDEVENLSATRARKILELERQVMILELERDTLVEEKEALVGDLQLATQRSSQQAIEMFVGTIG
jgi:hypothetical protein